MPVPQSQQDIPPSYQSVGSNGSSRPPHVLDTPVSLAQDPAESFGVGELRIGLPNQQSKSDILHEKGSDDTSTEKVFKVGRATPEEKSQHSHKNPDSNAKEEYEFISILRDSKPEQFASCKFEAGLHATSNLPNIPDTIAHLKLLRAFSVMKSNVIGVGKDEKLNAKNWQVFITNAVRRFIVFVTCLKHKYGPVEPSDMDEMIRYTEGAVVDDDFNEAMKLLLPPLDVLMVWHSFSLNPRSFYDNFMRNDFYKFANMPFPFYMVNQAIDNRTFEYNPGEKYQLGYFAVLETFIDGNTPNQVFDLKKFDVSKGFNMFEYLVDVTCPKCKETILSNVPYTNDDKVGFADQDFKWATTRCECNFPKTLTHDELRKRQMYQDSKNRATVFPGVYKNFSKILSHEMFKYRNCVKINESLIIAFDKYVEDILPSSTLDRCVILSSSSPRSAKPMRLIFREYLLMNLIQATVKPPPGSDMAVFEVTDDLVGCVVRQEKFVEKMNEIDWLRSPVVRESLQESSVRYSRFFRLLTRYDQKQMLVPTLDIDLIWHTHQLSTHYYFKDCLASHFTTVVDHDDKVEQGRLDNAFEKTCKLYRSKFGQEYSICFCWYCVCVRANSHSKIGKIFGKKNTGNDTSKYESNPLFVNSLGLTHISLHNAIEMPSRGAVNQRQKLQKKYARNGATDGDVPWATTSMAYYYPWMFVAAPMAPIGMSQAGFYGNGMCCTVHDLGPTCSGVGACGGLSCGGGTTESALCGNGCGAGASSGANCGGGGCGGGCGGGGCGGGGN